jgi:hypothetical protein
MLINPIQPLALHDRDAIASRILDNGEIVKKRAVIVVIVA